jgi:hypothetical protein
MSPSLNHKTHIHAHSCAHSSAPKPRAAVEPLAVSFLHNLLDYSGFFYKHGILTQNSSRTRETRDP